MVIKANGIGGCYLEMKMFMKARAWFSPVSGPEMSSAGVGGAEREIHRLAVVIGPITINGEAILKWCVPCHAVICRKLMALHLNSRMYGINVIGFFFFLRFLHF